MPSISQPGITTTTNFTTTTSLTIQTPALVPCIVGPIYNVQSGVNASGSFDATANGDQEFALPGFISGNILDESSVIIKLLLSGATGNTLTLNNPNNETVISTGTNGTFSAGSGDTLLLVDGDVSNWANEKGAAVGHAIRYTYIGRTYNLIISSLTATQLTLEVPKIDGLDHPLKGNTGSSQSYSLVSNPRNYDIKTSDQPNKYRFGSNVNYIEFTGKGDFAFGENKFIQFVDQALVKGTEGFFGKNAIVTDASFFTDANVNTNGGVNFVVENATNQAQGNAHLPLTVTRLSDTVAGLTGATSSDTLTVSGSGKKILLLKANSTSLVAAYTSYTHGDKKFTFGSGITNSTVYYVRTSGGANLTSGNETKLHRGVGNSSQEIILSGSSISDGGNTITIDAVYELVAELAGQDILDTSFAANEVVTNASSIAITNFYVDKETVGTAALEISDVTHKAAGLVTLSSNALGNGSGIAFHINPKDAAISVSNTTDTISIALKYALGEIATSYADVIAAIGTSNPTVSASNGGSSPNDSEALSYDNTVGKNANNKFEFDGGGRAGAVVINQNIYASNSFIQGTWLVQASYRALRVDLSTDITQVDNNPLSASYYQTIIGKPTTKNPMALAASIAFANMSNKSLQVISVNATSDSAIYGTVAAYSAAFSILEGKSVYAIAPLSQDVDVTSALSTHVTSMSSTENKAERIAFISREFPSHSLATRVVSSGALTASPTASTSGSWTLATNVDFSQVDGMPASSALGTTDVILVIDSLQTDSAKNSDQVKGLSSSVYGIKMASYSGTTVTFGQTTADIKDDWDLLSSGATFAVYVSGAAISAKADQASAIAAMGAQYNNRRVFLVYPGTVSVNTSVALDGSASASTSVPSFYAASALVGMVADKPVGQGFTNLAVGNILGVTKSSDYFTKSQLNSIAGGGTLILFQEGLASTTTSPVLVRHQLATDVSSIVKRELSITKSIDRVSQTLRATLKPTIGVFNITNALLETITMSIQSILGRMKNEGVIAGGSLSSIAVNSANPDTIDVTISIAPLFPCNYIEITINV